MSSDPRSLSLALYHALSSKVRQFEELTPRQARALIVDGLSLLPDFIVSETEVPHVLRMRTKDGHEFDFNIQDAADALLHLHEDFRKLVEDTQPLRSAEE